MPWTALPTLGFVARNVGGTAFPNAPVVPMGGGTERHELVKTTYDAGFALSPKLGRRDQLTLAFDWRDMLDATKTNMLRKLNFGLEYGAARFFFFRAGFSEGYFTAGLGLSTKAGSLDVGTYGEELDASGIHGFLDRRYSLRLTRRF
jgi:hypothetical protein